MDEIIRTPLTYYGGKQQLAARIISMMPVHKIYCEPFFGGGAVFFAKPKSYLEVINDRNDRLITFYRQAKENFDELSRMIESSLHSESEYLKAKDIYNGRILAGEIEMAWSVWMATNSSFNGSMHGGWKWCNGSSGSHTGIFLRNKRSEFNESVRIRLQDVQISCRDALKVIKERDTPNTFFYLDPPYPGCVQGHYHGYTHRDLYDLLSVLERIKGKFILSNYWCQTIRYFVLKNGWKVKNIEMPLKTPNSFVNGMRKTESLIYNYSLEISLFDSIQ